MNKSQMFTLLVITGLIILGIVALNLLRETRSALREKAKGEAISQGIQDAKSFLGRFRN